MTRDEPYTHIDLCTGLGGWREPFEESGSWRSVGLDVRSDLRADIIGDVRKLPINCNPTLVTASPPCTEFSSAWNAVKPPDERDPDMSVYNGCLDAINDLNPEYWVLENVAQAQIWFGKSGKNVGPYHFWGEYPAFDAGAPERKTTQTADGNGAWVDSSEQAAKIPFHIADALRRSVEWTYSTTEVTTNAI